MGDWSGRKIALGTGPAANPDPEGAERKSGNIRPFGNRAMVTQAAGSATFVTLTLTLGGRDVMARMRADAAVAAGQVFDFAINLEKAVTFDLATNDLATKMRGPA